MVGEDGFQCTMTPVEPGGFFRRDDGGASKSAKTSLEDGTLRERCAKAGGLYVEENFVLPVQITALERLLSDS